MYLNPMDPPQPDLDAIAGGFEFLGDQFQLCANLPAYQGGQQILVALNEITQQLREVNQRLDGLDARIGRNETRSSAM